MTECPNHEGNFDCTPFCRTCGGEQEFQTFVCPACKQDKPYSEGHGDCQACDDCCKDTEGEDGKIIYCHPYYTR